MDGDLRLPRHLRARRRRRRHRRGRGDADGDARRRRRRRDRDALARGERRARGRHVDQAFGRLDDQRRRRRSGASVAVGAVTFNGEYSYNDYASVASATRVSAALISFSSSEPSALAVNAATGALALRTNFATPITLTASSVCAAVDARRRAADDGGDGDDLRQPAPRLLRRRSRRRLRRAVWHAEGGRPHARRRAHQDGVRVDGGRGGALLPPRRADADELEPDRLRRAPAGAWVDNAGDNLAGTFTLPDGATDEYDFVVTIVGQPASAVAAAGADGTLIGTVGFTVVAEGGEHFLAADGEVVCADGSLVSLSGEAADGSFVLGGGRGRRRRRARSRTPPRRSRSGVSSRSRRRRAPPAAPPAAAPSATSTATAPSTSPT